MRIVLAVLVAAAFSVPLAASAQDHQAGMVHPGPVAPVAEPGQGAFAAIAEIVARLQADPATDWSKVDVEALRQHLIDMDNVTLRSVVAAAEVPGGAAFTVTSVDPAVQASIERMTVAHAATMTDPSGWRYEAEPKDKGAVLTVSGDAAQIRALGFIGVMTVGMHHQAHHWAIASGVAPHE